MPLKFCLLREQHSGLIEHLGSLFSYALLLCRNRAEAEDLVQETYLRAIRALPGLYEDSNIKVWLRTILRNLWINQLRRSGSGPGIVDIDSDESTSKTLLRDSADPHSVYLAKTERDHVRKAINHLPTELGEAIFLREYEGLSYQEISRLLRCPPGTVMSRLSRAKAKLRTILCESLPMTGARKCKSCKQSRPGAP